MRKTISVILLAFSIGCASAVVRPYIGEQQAWPIATGGIVNMKYGYPIFTSLPPSPYEVIGELRIESPLYAVPEEGHMPILIRKAQELEADAIVFVEGNVFFSTNYGPRPGDANAAPGGAQPTLTQVNRFNPNSFQPGVTILAVRWIGEPPPGLTSHKQEKEKADKAGKEATAQPATETAPPAEPAAPPTEAAPATPAPAPTEAAPPAAPAPETSAAPAAAEPAPAAAPAEQPKFATPSPAPVEPPKADDQKPAEPAPEVPPLAPQTTTPTPASP